MHKNLVSAVDRCLETLSSPPLLKCPHCGESLTVKVFLCGRPRFNTCGDLEIELEAKYYCPETGKVAKENRQEEGWIKVTRRTNGQEWYIPGVDPRLEWLGFLERKKEIVRSTEWNSLMRLKV